VLPTTNSPDRSASIFSSYDLDGNGVLTVPEFVPVAFAVSRKADDEANKVFKVFLVLKNAFQIMVLY
jgi:Ca2+-binding EF-hand superfamily protein